MECNLKEIPITDLTSFQIGNAENQEAGTGCTVILALEGAVCGLDVRGGGPASKESQLLNPLMANDCVNAVVLTGGSAFGLDAASGVMRYLEERDIGFQTGYGVVPIVPASAIFDLGVGKSKIRPDAAMGYEACRNAPNFQPGNHGAGCGASCGKVWGEKYCMKSGIGSACYQLGDLKVGAVVVANPLGNIVNPDTGEILAGMHEDAGWIDAEQALLSTAALQAGKNTTIGAVITNAKFNKAELSKIAGMAHDGMARAIRPVHTMYDGDSIYALSHGEVFADINLVGVLAAKAFGCAIVNGAMNSETAYGILGRKQ